MKAFSFSREEVFRFSHEDGKERQVACCNLMYGQCTNRCRFLIAEDSDGYLPAVIGLDGAEAHVLCWGGDDIDNSTVEAYCRDCVNSIRRVADRVEQGGHDVPLEDLQRRFKVCVQNLFTVYRPVIDRWSLHDNGQHVPVLLAYGDARDLTVVAKEVFAKVAADFNLPV